MSRTSSGRDRIQLRGACSPALAASQTASFECPRFSFERTGCQLEVSRGQVDQHRRSGQSGSMEESLIRVDVTAASAYRPSRDDPRPHLRSLARREPATNVRGSSSCATHRGSEPCVALADSTGSIARHSRPLAVRKGQAGVVEAGAGDWRLRREEDQALEDV